MGCSKARSFPGEEQHTYSLGLAKTSMEMEKKESKKVYRVYPPNLIRLSKPVRRGSRPAEKSPLSDRT